MSVKAKQANISSFFLPRAAPSAAPPATPSSTTRPPYSQPPTPSTAPASLVSPKARAKPSLMSTALFSPPTPLPPTPPSSSSLSSPLPLTPSSLSELTGFTPPSPPSELQGRKRKPVNYAELTDDIDEDEPLTAPVGRKKGRRIDDDDEEEYLPGMAVDEDKEGEKMEVEEVAVVKRPLIRRPSPPTPSHVQPRSLSFPSPSDKVVAAVLHADLTVDPDATTTKKASDVTSAKEWDDSFLRPENLRDAKGVKVGQPGYDPSTLSIPTHIWKTLTPAQQQYFDIKKNNFDLVLFYKIGKVSPHYPPPPHTPLPSSPTPSDSGVVCSFMSCTTRTLRLVSVSWG